MLIWQYVALRAPLYVDYSSWRIWVWCLSNINNWIKMELYKMCLKMSPGTLKTSNHERELPTRLRRIWLYSGINIFPLQHRSSVRCFSTQILKILRYGVLLLHLQMLKITAWSFLTCWNLLRHRGRKLPVDGRSAPNLHGNSLIFFLVAVRPAVHTVTEWSGWWPGEGEWDPVSLSVSLPLSAICRPREQLWLD